MKSFKGQVKGLEKAHHKHLIEIKELRKALDAEKIRHKQVDEVRELREDVDAEKIHHQQIDEIEKLRKDLDAFFEQYRCDGVHTAAERGAGR